MAYITKELEEDLLQCAVCLQPFKDPRSLPCLHTFCLSCLETHVKSSQTKRGKGNGSGNNSFTCPTCRDVTKLPAKGISGFRSDFKVNKVAALLERMQNHDEDDNDGCYVCKIDLNAHIKAQYYCRDCGISLCQSCICKHDNRRLFLGHSIQMATQDDIREKCEAHPSSHVQYYCATCDCRVCSVCIIGSHDNHNVSTADSDQKTLRNLVKFECIKEEFQEHIAVIQDQRAKIEVNSNQLKNEIDDHTTSLVRDLQDQADTLKARIEECKADALKMNEVREKRQREQLEQLKLVQAEVLTQTTQDNESPNIDLYGSRLQAVVETMEASKSNQIGISAPDDLPRFVPRQGRIQIGVLSSTCGIGSLKNRSTDMETERGILLYTHMRPAEQMKQTRPKNKFAHFMKKLYTTHGGVETGDRDMKRTASTSLPVTHRRPLQRLNENAPQTNVAARMDNTTVDAHRIRGECSENLPPSIVRVPEDSPSAALPSAPPLSLIMENEVGTHGFGNSNTHRQDPKSDRSVQLTRSCSMPSSTSAQQTKSSRSSSTSSCPDAAPLNLHLGRRSSDTFCGVMFRELLGASSTGHQDQSSSWASSKHTKPKYMEDHFR